MATSFCKADGTVVTACASANVDGVVSGGACACGTAGLADNGDHCKASTNTIIKKCAANAINLTLAKCNCGTAGLVEVNYGEACIGAKAVVDPCTSTTGADVECYCMNSAVVEASTGTKCIDTNDPKPICPIGIIPASPAACYCGAENAVTGEHCDKVGADAKLIK